MELFTIRDLTFSYPEQPQPALRSLSLTVERGEFLVLCGPSGCGKTTTLRTIIENGGGTVTLFSFDANQGLSEHTAPFDAMVCILDGEARITIGGKPHHLKTGESIIMPANVPHALDAVTAFKMMLIMIKA